MYASKLHISIIAAEHIVLIPRMHLLSWLYKYLLLYFCVLSPYVFHSECIPKEPLYEKKLCMRFAVKHQKLFKKYKIKPLKIKIFNNRRLHHTYSIYYVVFDTMYYFYNLIVLFVLMHLPYALFLYCFHTYLKILQTTNLASFRVLSILQVRAKPGYNMSAIILIIGVQWEWTV
jgi:hypothetical protein